MSAIRQPAVAGLFYPAESAQLAADIQHLLAEAQPHKLNPKALIAPHAGYVYSGPIAATAYAALDSVAAHIRRVVLLGPTHRVAVHGLALPAAEAFDTPLGRVMLDQEATRAIAHLPQVTISPEAHELEHSLEVQLPFLQSVLPAFSLLPLAVGMASAEQVAEVLEAVWGGDETLIVISSDLSHYLPYATAQRVDGETVESILQLRQPIAHDHACGGTPISGLILAAQQHDLVPHLLDLRNSGDTAGSRDQVVGYAAIVFTEEERPTLKENHEQGRTLVELARNSIAEQFGTKRSATSQADWLQQPGATFVTLTLDGELRGCIGSLQPHRPLAEDVYHNAAAAAFHDPRFPPLTAEEFADVQVEVSLLTEPQPLGFADEADALAQLCPGVDGIVFEYGRYRSTFLPQVWEHFPKPRDFLAMLKRKAGLPDNFWADGVRLQRYHVTKWREAELTGVS
ncbi:MAG TPA: AmmeMemoRadiSam system protein B [Gallionella sp.]|nr:AmmeMemoRadiSam system protein B [Gallionella sp.]